MKKSSIILALLLAVACNTCPVDIVPVNTDNGFTCRAICAVNDSVVWAAGSGNTVLMTLDGGETWKQCSMPDTLKTEYRSIYAWDAQTALVFTIDKPAVAYKTNDGGQTWRQVYYSDADGMFIDSATFGDGEHGVAVGDPVDGHFVVLRSDDAGESWHEVEAPAGDGGMFAASNTCVDMLPSGKTLFATGTTASDVWIQLSEDDPWTCSCPPIASPLSVSNGTAAPQEKGKVASVPQDADNGCYGCYGVRMFDDLHGFVYGGNYEYVHQTDGVMARTEDGGNSWTEVKGLHGFVSSLERFPQSEDCMIASGSDGMSCSTDGGKTWTDITSQLPDCVPGYHALSAADGGSVIYAAGGRGCIAKILLRSAK